MLTNVAVERKYFNKSDQMPEMPRVELTNKSCLRTFWQ